MDTALVDALDRADAEAAIAWIEREDDPARVLAMYHGAIRHAYWSRKDIRSVAALGRAAGVYGASLDEPRLLGLLKAVLYDLGSFCWPGWDEPDIAIDDETLAIGRDAADRNLSLASQLDRPALALAAAHWLVGAHELARARRDDAAASFARAVDLAREANDTTSEALYGSYEAMARGSTVDLDALRNVEDGDDLVEQVETAVRLFAT